MLVLVPHLDQPIAFARRRKQRTVRTERHVVHRRGRLAFPHTLPAGCVLVIGTTAAADASANAATARQLNRRRARITIANLERHGRRHAVVSVSGGIAGQPLVPHLDVGAAGQQARSLQVPRQRRNVRACLQRAGLHPAVLESVRRRLVVVDERRWLEDAHLVLVGGGDFARVGAAIERRDADVVVRGARYDLHSLEGAGQHDDVAAGGVRLVGWMAT